MKGLGTLEVQVMDIMWGAQQPLSVHDVTEALAQLGRHHAYTTILTVLTNLYDKDWVQREKHSRAYYYSARRSRIEATTDLLREILDDSSDASAALLHFARTASAREIDALQQGLAEGGQQR